MTFNINFDHRWTYITSIYSIPNKRKNKLLLIFNVQFGTHEYHKFALDRYIYHILE